MIDLGTPIRTARETIERVIAVGDQPTEVIMHPQVWLSVVEAMEYARVDHGEGIEGFALEGDLDAPLLYITNLSLDVPPYRVLVKPFAVTSVEVRGSHRRPAE